VVTAHKAARRKEALRQRRLFIFGRTLFCGGGAFRILVFRWTRRLWAAANVSTAPGGCAPSVRRHFAPDRQTMRISLTILILALGQTLCGQVGKYRESDSFDTSHIAIFRYNSTQTWIFKDGKQAALSKAEFELLDSLLTNCVTTYNNEQRQKYKGKHSVKNHLINLQSHKRQYIAIINNKGETEVWINCFCDTHDRDWRRELIIVDDGGVCYFNLKVNLTKKTFYDLVVNGTA
jgi:hypothetical protein